jgi:hypothetical protein
MTSLFIQVAGRHLEISLPVSGRLFLRTKSVRLLFARSIHFVPYADTRRIPGEMGRPRRILTPKRAIAGGRLKLSDSARENRP